MQHSLIEIGRAQAGLEPKLYAQLKGNLRERTRSDVPASTKQLSHPSPAFTKPTREVRFTDPLLVHDPGNHLGAFPDKTLNCEFLAKFGILHQGFVLRLHRFPFQSFRLPRSSALLDES